MSAHRRHVTPRDAPACFITAARSHSGCVRTLNEDAYLARPEIGVWAVADGMGGHAAGDVASATVMAHLGGVTDVSSGFAMHAEARHRLQAAHAELQRRARDGGATMGATTVVLLAHGDHFACLWAGDSRAYLLRHGRLTQITHDHSVVQELVDAGVIERDSARRHALSNVVTRAIGAGGELELGQQHGDLCVGDRFILCSDGLTAVVEDDAIAALGSCLSPEATADELLRRALDGGAPDNVTLLIVDVTRCIGPDLVRRIA